jgi:hypothetical protein
MNDAAIASILILGTLAFLARRNLTYLATWLVLITIVLAYGARLRYTPAVILAIGVVIAVIWVSGTRLREQFENEKGEEDEKAEPKEAGDDESPEPHLDMGSTLLSAYKRMKPEQVSQMRNDTKELMETQQQLIETLSMLGPQVQQGAELVKSFQGMFGGNLMDVLKQ